MRNFYSPDPLVTDLAQKIDSRYPGHVIDVNTILDGQEIDILTRNAIIEVKAGSSGLTLQVTKRLSIGLYVIAYSPKLNWQAIREINAMGGIAVTDLNLMLDTLRP